MKQLKLLLFLALSTFTAFHAFSETYSGSCGENVTWALDTETGVLTISGTGAMKDFVNTSPWYAQCTTVRTVIINTGVTSIGDYAFWYCSSLTSIIIPESVKSIGNNVFHCKNLTSIILPESVTSIGNYAFYDCSSLTSVTFPKDLTSIGERAFSGCSGLASIIIPEGVTSIGERAFEVCCSLTSITIPKSVVTIGSGAFVGCNGLTSINIPKGVTSIGSEAFAECSSLTSINIPEGVTSIGNWAFAKCSSLTSITLPESVTNIGNSAFSLCTSLSSITIPKGVTSIGNWAFSECSSLGSITIPEGVTSIGDQTFLLCSELASVTLSTSMTSIGYEAFRDCSNLTSVTFPEGVTNIGDEAFYGCRSLTSITIPKGVKNIGGCVFSDCYNLSSVTLPEGVTSIGYQAFYNCSILASITIPEGVTSIDRWAFYGCPLSKVVNLSNCDISVPMTCKVYGKNDLVNFTKNSFVYSDSVPVPEYTRGSAPFTASWQKTPSLEKNVGTYTTSCKFHFFDEDLDFNAAIPYTYTITPAPVTVNVTSVSREYGEANPEFTYTVDGLFGNDNIEVTVTAPDHQSKVGDYSFTASTIVKNYSVANTTGTLTITKAPLKVCVDNASKVYGDANPKFTARYQGFKNGDAVSAITTAPVISSEASVTSAVGEYAITAEGGEAQNYEFTEYVPATLTVTKAPLTVVADSAAKVYGDANPAFTLQYQGFRNNDDASAIATAPSISSAADERSAVGEYAITAEGGEAKNYEFTNYEPSTLTITKAPLTVVVDSAMKVYGDANPIFTVQYRGLKNGDGATALKAAPSITSDADVSSSVGNYAITATGGEAQNYKFAEYIHSMLTITKAPLSVTVDSATKVYGDANPAFTLQYQGLRNNDDASAIATAPSISSVADEKSVVGEYAITAEGGEAKNYEFTNYEPSTLTITKAPLTVVVDSAMKVYGDANPAFTLQYIGFKNKDNVSSLSYAPAAYSNATKSSEVGEYPIMVADGVAKNYEFQYEPGVLYITKAPLSVSAVSTTKVYGDVNPELSLKYQGFKNDDDTSSLTNVPIAYCNASKSSPAGEYAITIADGVAQNYEFQYSSDAVLTITKAPLKVSADNASKVYGDANPEFTVQYQGFKNEDDASAITTAPSISSEANVTSAVGEYAITATGGEAQNYEFTEYVPGTLTVTKAPLAIVANSVSRLYFEDTPEFTFSGKGWKNNEDASVLTAQPTIQCAAEKTSPAGVYDIVPSGAEAQNYDISYQNGSLTIGKRTLTVTAKDAERCYGEENPKFECSFDGFVNDETAAVLTTMPEAVTTAEQWSDVGTYSIVMQGGEATNYAFEYVAGTLSVLKAQQQIEWEQALDTVAVGSQVLLTATATSGLEVTYKYDDSMVEVYSSFDGMVLDCFKEGTVTIRATQEGNQNYHPAERVVKTINIVSTGIAPVIQEGEDAIYDLQGRKVLEAVKGFYIQNGKKVYRK